MTPLVGIGPVGKSGAVVQLAVIIDELHIAGLKLHRHMEIRIVGQRIKQIKRFYMFVCQTRCVVEPLGAFDVLALIEYGQLARVP